MTNDLNPAGASLEGTLLFNVNYSVWVKITPDGLDGMRRRHDAFNATCNNALGPFREPTVDADGWTRFQLWSLMEEFGSSMHLGMTTPFDTTIRLDLSETKAARTAPPPASPSAPQGVEVPEGWVLVPREPTPEIVRAMHDLWLRWEKERIQITGGGGDVGRFGWAEEYWRAALSAIQTSPVSGLAAIGAPDQRWRDVSTAPRDGTHILVKFDGTTSPPTVAHWFGPADLPGLRSGGWYLSVQQLEGPAIYPTHWRPLP